MKIEIWGVCGLILAVLIGSGCRTKEVIVEKWSERVVVEERIDTVVVVRGGTVSEVTPLSLLGHGFTHVVEHDIARIEITIDTLKNELRTDIFVPDREVPVEMSRTTTTTSEGSRREVTKTPTRIVPWWAWFLLGVVVGVVSIFTLRRVL